MSAPETITVWVCDECGYWRKEKATGVHQTNDPTDWRGRMVTHPLREAVYVPVSVSTEGTNDA